MRWFGMRWTSERTHQSSASLGTLSTFQVKGQRSKLSSEQREATLKNWKYKTYFDLFYSFIVLKLSVKIYMKIKRKGQMRRCVQSFDWRCRCLLQSVAVLRPVREFFVLMMKSLCTSLRSETVRWVCSPIFMFLSCILTDLHQFCPVGPSAAGTVTINVLTWMKSSRICTFNPCRMLCFHVPRGFFRWPDVTGIIPQMIHLFKLLNEYQTYWLMFWVQICVCVCVLHIWIRLSVNKCLPSAIKAEVYLP